MERSLSGTMQVLVVACCVVVAMAGMSSSRCRPKSYLYRAVQTDLNGRRCWGDVEIKACHGYCLTYEIADWQFPYKESSHPVCGHGYRTSTSAKLTHCDPDVQPGTDNFHFIEAANCTCTVCQSDNTSCEWIPTNSALLSDLILKQEDFFEPI